jgi:hypothetical protein
VSEASPQKAPATDLANFVKKREVATAAFCDPRPTATPVSAAALQGVGLFAFTTGAGLDDDNGSAWPGSAFNESSVESVA